MSLVAMAPEEPGYSKTKTRITTTNQFMVGKRSLGREQMPSQQLMSITMAKTKSSETSPPTESICIKTMLGIIFQPERLIF